MKGWWIVTLVAGLLVAALLHGGIYEIRVAGGESAHAFRLNKFTGTIAYCKEIICFPVHWRSFSEDVVLPELK